MTPDQIAVKMTELIADELSVDASVVTPEAKFEEDLGADSLDTLELVMRAEDEFEIEIPDEETGGLKTVGDAVRLVTEKLRTSGEVED